MRRFVAALLKFGLSAAIIAYLVRGAMQDREFGRLWSCQKDWGLLALAFGFLVVNALLIHTRWFFLLRTLDLPIRLADALQVSCLGYFVNFVPVGGVVGGDVTRAVMVARQFRGAGAKATASVMVDRLLGLYTLFLISSTAILATGFWRISQRMMIVSLLTLGVTVAGLLAGGLLCLPLLRGPKARALLARVPYAGSMLVQLGEAVAMYRRRGPMLVLAIVLSVAANVAFAIGAHLIGAGLYGQVPALAHDLVAVPVAGSTGAIPLALGPFEVVLELLYKAVGMPAHQGFIVALGWRLMTLTIGILGFGYYALGYKSTALAACCPGDDLAVAA